MPTLLLLRHAKSGWDDPELPDHERPLSERGRRAAPAMGRRLRAAGLAPDLVLCSSAQRARETWALVAPQLARQPKLLVEDGLYLCGAAALLARLGRLRREETVLVVAHNPDLHELAAMLAGDGAPADLARLAAKFPTGALAALAVPDWRELAAGRSRLIFFATPRGEGVLS